MKVFKRYFLIILLNFIMYEGIAQTHLEVQDTRSIATTPSSYSRTFEAHLKYGTSINLSSGAGSNAYYSLLGIRGWNSDNTGGKAHELAFGNDAQIYYRSGHTPVWQGWKKLVIANVDGSLGIGTTDPKGYMLAVNGKIRAQEIKVETANWPDYVFAKGYQLPSLEEMEKHIQEKGHLPGIPSAKEVKENGISLGEMNNKLLQKIEELTLHLIRQDREINSLKEIVQKYKLQ